MADVRALLRQQRAARGLDQTSRHGETQLRKQKRKHVEDTEMSVDDLDDGAAYRHKRSRPASEAPAKERDASQTTASEKAEAEDGSAKKSKESTPQAATPQVSHRTNGTPAHGIEIKIPSRPATPNTPKDALGGSSNSSGGGLSTASTPKTVPIGRSPLVPQEETIPATIVEAAASEAPQSATETKSQTVPAAKADIDEDEWAAFEAEVVNGPAPGAAVDAKSAINGAAISAPPVTADGAPREEHDARRRDKEASAMDDEKEEATRALEAEFEEMEELEARVKKLKEKRDALRQVLQRKGSTGAAESTGKENARQQAGSKADATAGGQDEEDDDDDDDASDEDDWDGFRFRA